MIGRWQRVAATILFILLFIGGFRPMFLRLLISRRSLMRPGPANGLDRRPLREWSDPTPPELQAFLQTVRAETRRGETIALVFGPPYDGFGFTYWRANYELSGRSVQLPGVVDGDVVAYWPEGKIERRR
jgi:hypothetical protein